MITHKICQLIIRSLIRDDHSQNCQLIIRSLIRDYHSQKCQLIIRSLIRDYHSQNQEGFRPFLDTHSYGCQQLRVYVRKEDTREVLVYLGSFKSHALFDLCFVPFKIFFHFCEIYVLIYKQNKKLLTV